MKKPLSLLFLLLAFTLAFSQNIRPCGTDELFQQNAARIPGYAQRVQHAFDVAKARANAMASRKFGEVGDTIYRIPVVVHIVYNTPQQNLHDSLVYNQIEVLNQDYRRLNADTGNTRSIFAPVAGDAGIEFFLATKDPNGDSTTGIIHKPTSIANFSALGGLFGGTAVDSIKKASKGSQAWDTDRYLNIWVCNLEEPFPLFGQVLGIAYPPDDAPNFPADSLFPTSADSSLHGIAIHYKVFGRNNPLAVDSPFNHSNMGRTVVHEVGHYLGLAHIWGNVTPFDPDGCALDDGVDDTPNSADNSQQAGCDVSKNTCHDDVPDLPDMFENYMDYSKERCQNLFTQGQIGVMRATLATSRKDLPEIYVVPADTTGPPDTTDVGIHSVRTIEMSIYPNPADDVLNIRFTENEQVQSITVGDLLGRRWLTVAVPAKNTTLDLSALPAGVYAVTAQSEHARVVRKVVVD